MQKIKNNGHKKKPKLIARAFEPPLSLSSNIFANLKIRDKIAEEFKIKAKESGLTQSEYLQRLMQSEYLENLFKDSSFAPTISNLLKYIERKSREQPIQQERLTRY